MGSGVAHARSNTTIRSYAHCHATNPLDLTVLLLNLDTTESSFVVIDTGAAEAEAATGNPTVEYHLTGQPHKPLVKLNGKILGATAEGVLSPIDGQAGVSTAVKLAPVGLSMKTIAVWNFTRTKRTARLT